MLSSYLSLNGPLFSRRNVERSSQLGQRILAQKRTGIALSHSLKTQRIFERAEHYAGQGDVRLSSSSDRECVIAFTQLPELVGLEIMDVGASAVVAELARREDVNRRRVRHPQANREGADVVIR